MERIKRLLDQYHYHIIISMGIVLVLMIVGTLCLLLLSNDNPSPANHSAIQMSTNQNISSDSSSVLSHESSSTYHVSKTESNGYVDLKGAVKRPGIYQINSEMRVNELIKMAGGLKSNAELKNINLAQKLVDQQVIYIAKKGESNTNVASENVSGVGASHDDTNNNSQVNINTADATQMQQITGVGEKRAEQIIAYREEHGPFQKIEDIKNVSGFGDKMFENMKESITV